MALPAAALAPRGGDLLAELDAMEIADTHEHLPPESERVSSTVDFFTLASHYVMNDAVSSGLAGAELETVRDAAKPLEERWRAFEPHWKAIRGTGYGLALSEALADLYGVRELSVETLRQANAGLKRDNRPGLYMRLLREKAKIRFCVLDSGWVAASPPPDPAFYRQAWHFDTFLSFSSAADIAAIEKNSGVTVSGVPGMKRAMETLLERRLAHGLSAVKTTIAYTRSLEFAETPESGAEAAFAQLSRLKRRPPRHPREYWTRPFRALEDHMMHHLARLLEDRRVPLQVHTGIFAGNASFISNSRPSLLANLLLLYPKLTFDLFHIGFPYQDEMLALVKSFPNAFIDFCWVYVLSERVAAESLHKALDLLPVNKILGFGGDYRYPELIYAHAKAARRIFGRVLEERVRGGWSTRKQAADAARAILLDNVSRIYPERR